ncbi:alanine dehydrogenase [Candidatus Woesearchaeota archaeon]|nr:alanine dehydrogenase [Candidatus Woesearchaeota archaeon]
MNIGVVKEIKDKENRVSVTPDGVKILTKAGHMVFVEENAGANSGFSNEEYHVAGAKIVDTATVWSAALVVKVKEPMEREYQYFKPGKLVFTYFHLAGVTKSLTDALLKNKVTAIAYETVEDNAGRLPLLAPMSAVAGNMAVTVGSYYLTKFTNGKGMQLGTVMGKPYGKVMVIGDGVVGKHAARTALGMGTNVYLFTRRQERIAQLKQELGQQLNVVLSTPENIASHVTDTDLLIGGVLLEGAKAPFVVTEKMVITMQPGSVIVDVSIDQGGCIETSKPTSHSNPVYTLHGVTHYCVTNMPGAYPRTSTFALTDATFAYLLKLANLEFMKAMSSDKGFAKGINTHEGKITYKPVAEALGMLDHYNKLENRV